MSRDDDDQRQQKVAQAREQFSPNTIVAHPRAEAPAPGTPPKPARVDKPLNFGVNLGGGGAAPLPRTMAAKTEYGNSEFSRTAFASKMGPGSFA